MSKLQTFALILIAGWAVNTWATGTNVYKCGASYSQTPCEGAVPVRVEDGRSSSQKVQSDTATRQQSRTADALEKKRVKEDAQARAEAIKLNQANAKATALANKNRAARAAYDAEKLTVLSPTTSKGKSKKAAEYFTAKASPEPRKSTSAPRP